jgi:hypothetical protein
MLKVVRRTDVFVVLASECELLLSDEITDSSWKVMKKIEIGNNDEFE